MIKLLADYVDEMVLVRSRSLDDENPVTVKLLAVENAGIWIEAQTVSEQWMQHMNISGFPRTPVWFVPFAQIAWILGVADYPTLSDRAIEPRAGE